MNNTAANPPDSRNSKLRYWKLSLIFLIFALVFFIFSGTIANVSLWGDLKAGLDNLVNRAIARSDSYSYLTEGRFWFNQEWLSQIIFAVAWSVGKVVGLVLLKILVGLLTVGIIFWSFSIQKIDTLISGIVLIVGSILLAADLATIFPQLFSLPLFALLLFVILRAEIGEIKWLWAVPFIFMFWANLDPSFLIGLLFFILWVSMYLVIHWLDWRLVILPVGIGIFATLINPYGWNIYKYLLFYPSDSLREVFFGTSLTIFSPFGFIYLFVLIISLVGFAYSGRRRSVILTILFSFSALLPLISRRNLSLFAVASMMLAGPYIAGLLMKAGWIRRQMKGAPGWVSSLVLVTAIALFIFSLPNLSLISVGQLQPNPVQAVQLIKDSQVNGNLGVEIKWGGYAIWHLSPRVKVSIDPRTRAVYSPKVYQDNVSFLLGLEDWSALIRDYQTDMVLVDSHSAAFNLMKMQQDWTLIYQDDVSGLFVRSGSALEPVLQQAVVKFNPLEVTNVFP